MKRIIIIGLALLAVCAWRYSSLYRHYIPTQGTILRLHSNEHIDYLYSVSGATHFGATTALGLQRDFTSIKIGDHLTVFYDAKHPDDSTTDPPATRGIMSIWLFIFVGALFYLGVRVHQQTYNSTDERDSHDA